MCALGSECLLQHSGTGDVNNMVHPSVLSIIKVSMARMNVGDECLLISPVQCEELGVCMLIHLHCFRVLAGGT